MIPSFVRRWLAPAPVARPTLYPVSDAAAVAEIRRAHPSLADATILAAERILRHEFELLGSGPFVPIDPDRPSRHGYAPIDWYLDPVRALRFPRGVRHDKWNLYEMRPANADVKYPWELARCQHWAVLGQAFLLTGDDRFAREIADELDDFVDANPIGVGINFTCTMDVAIRAVNWAIGLQMVRGSAALDAAFWRRADRALYDTGVFTRDNLENKYEVTSNHFLSNVVGLWFLGAVFDQAAVGREWQAFARASLEREIVVQVLPDGADYESSVPYHRLVTELFLASLWLGDVRQTPLSDGYRARVHDMVAFLAAVTRPDGLMPQIGDADDGRLHTFTRVITPQDPRHLFGPAGAIFSDPSWQRLGGDDGRWEAAWWGLGPSAPAKAAPASSRLFPDAGLAVMRSGAHYLIATNGIVGTNGFGNHKHNDQLSFEYHPDGVALIVDSGSYVYTSDFDARNRFRSTAAHNTLQIDAAEQNDLKPEWIFRLFETSNAEHVTFDDGPDVVRYVGRHHGYERLVPPVGHERELRLNKSDGALDIVDRVSGMGTHQLRWHFHLSPGVDAMERDASTIELRGCQRRWVLTLPDSCRGSIRAGQYSPSYGVAVPCVTIEVALTAQLTGHDSWSFRITP